MAREDVVASEAEASDDSPSGKIGITVGTEGEMRAWDEVKVEEDEEEERVREDAMIDMVVIFGVSEGVMLEAELGSDCEAGVRSEGFKMLPSVVSDGAPVHVGGVTGVMTGTDATVELVVTHELSPGDISEEPASVDRIPGETVLEA